MVKIDLSHIRVARASCRLTLALAPLLAVACASLDRGQSVSGLSNVDLHDAPLSGCNRSEFDTPPLITSGKRPQYPAGRQLAGETGEATATFRVTETGAIADLQAVATGSQYFANHLVAAMNTWVLSPAYLQGKPVSTHCSFTMKFTLF